MNRTFFQRAAAFFLTLVLIAAMCTCGAAEDKTGLDTASIQEDGFAYVSRSKKNSFYTPVMIGDYVVYAFVDRDGLPAFRMYGTMNGKEGYYPVSLMMAEDTAGVIHLKGELLSQTPVQDHTYAGGRVHVKPLDAVPEGFRAGKDHSFYLVNVFGEKETFVYGTYDEQHYGYYRVTNGTRPAAGSLPVDLDGIRARKLQDGAERLKKPSYLSVGMRDLVTVTTSDGRLLNVYTSHPDPLAKAESESSAGTDDYANAAPFREYIPDKLETVQLSDKYVQVVGMDRAFEMYWDTIPEYTDTVIAACNNAFDSLPDGIKISLYFVENSRSHPLMEGSFPEDSDIYLHLKDQLHVDGIDHLKYTTFEQYCQYFYTTDHHWNFRGSYQGYKDIAHLLGVPDEDLLIPAETVVCPVYFNGACARGINKEFSREYFALYRFDGYPKYNAYYNNGKRPYGSMTKYLNGAFNTRPMTNHYALCYGGDHGLLRLESTEKTSAGGNLLIIGDSFVNATVGLLMRHFDSIVHVDLRYYAKETGLRPSLSDMVSRYQIDQILVLGNFGWFNNPANDMLEP